MADRAGPQGDPSGGAEPPELGGGLLVAVGDPPPAEIVGRQLHLHPIPFEHTDVVLPHLAGEVRQHLVAVLQLDPERCIG